MNHLVAAIDLRDRAMNDGDLDATVGEACPLDVRPDPRRGLKAPLSAWTGKG